MKQQANQENNPGNYYQGISSSTNVVILALTFGILWANLIAIKQRNNAMRQRNQILEELKKK